MILHTRALIHINDPHFQFLSEEIYCVRALSKNWATNTILSWIDELDSLLIIVNFLEGDNWTEELLSLCSHTIVGIDNNSWLKESSKTFLICILISTNQNLSTHIDCILANFL